MNSRLPSVAVLFTSTTCFPSSPPYLAAAPEASTPDAVDADSADLQGEEEDCADDAGCDAAAEEDEEDDATWEFAK